MTTERNQPPGGLPQAIAAYVIWGVFPLYLWLLRAVPPLEFVGWRILFTIPVCVFLIVWQRQRAELFQALGNPKALGLLTLSALLIGGNWLVYVIAIQEGHVFAASLGYYINPIVNVIAGTLFLKEKLTGRQWLAVAVATAGVSLLAWGARDMLGISLMLAMSFAGYGLVRKLVPAGSLVGLTIESVILAPVAVGILFWRARGDADLAFGGDPAVDVLLALSGVITATALLLFTVAARRMDYSTLGFVQYIAPTMVFLQGLFLFGEPLRPVQLACFIAIWSAIAIYSWDLLSRRPSKRRGET